jgi:hypothetical protein
MKFTPCTVKELPPESHADAVALAVSENPANAPLMQVSFGAPLTPARLYAYTQKYWSPGGVDLTVSFVDQPKASFRDKVLSHMNAWGEFCNVRFRWVSSGGDVRIGLDPNDGHWSYLGTDVRSVPRNQKTMNLALTERSGDAELRRVVSHEAGHTCGFGHEHLRRELVQKLDPQKTIAYFRRWQGWDEQVTRSNVLTPVEEASVMGSVPADDTSIMCYGISGECTLDGKPIQGGVDFSPADRTQAAKLYPKSTSPGAAEIVIRTAGTYVLKQ